MSAVNCAEELDFRLIFEEDGRQTAGPDLNEDTSPPQWAREGGYPEVSWSRDQLYLPLDPCYRDPALCPSPCSSMSSRSWMSDLSSCESFSHVYDDVEELYDDARLALGSWSPGVPGCGAMGKSAQNTSILYQPALSPHQSPHQSPRQSPRQSPCHSPRTSVTEESWLNRRPTSRPSSRPTSPCGKRRHSSADPHARSPSPHHSLPTERRAATMTPLRTSSPPPLDWPLPSQFDQCELKLEVQPKSYHRAHYETEGSRGSIIAATGGHPVVKLSGYSEQPISLLLFIGTADDRYLRPHSFYQVHRVTGKTVTTTCQEKIMGGTKVLEIPLLPENNMSASVVLQFFDVSTNDCRSVEWTGGPHHHRRILKLRNAEHRNKERVLDINLEEQGAKARSRVAIPVPDGRCWDRLSPFLWRPKHTTFNSDLLCSEHVVEVPPAHKKTAGPGSGPVSRLEREEKKKPHPEPPPACSCDNHPPPPAASCSSGWSNRSIRLDHISTIHLI
ncbi:nuclear factor of activated T-cells, cytoplasmic 3-like protein [Lates japonicus]|uniref:Nuclear factor of activated T-cells, cytoplasmic 3-like protein n=1 Tax=Lates japonicus TaxID=270547 RepID=A0AAD3RLE0_LATJO|nr:nuclear factor of activated T-cells, cytoplasmic 3-like protein [Lates japonicus]